MGDRLIPGHTDATVTRGSDTKLYDPTGCTLADYPRPSVAVDTALLTRDPARGLVVLEVARGDTEKWALPGTFLHKGETLADAVERSLRDKAGAHGIRPRQLHVFDAPERDDRGWVLSVAHVAVVRPDQLESLESGPAAEVRLVPVDRPGELVWDHSDIVRLAKQHIRSRYLSRPDPDRLLGTKFTLRELHQVHEDVAGDKLPRDKFRRAMEPQLIPTGVINDNTGARGRPAEFFRRKP
jgi:8-oxo-dGTP diphosphatase